MEKTKEKIEGEKESEQEERIRRIGRTAELERENRRREIRANMNSRQQVDRLEVENDKLKMKVGLLEAELNEARDLLAKLQVEVEPLVGDEKERKMDRRNNNEQAGKFQEKKEKEAVEAEGEQKENDGKQEKGNNLGRKVLIEKQKNWKAKDMHSWLIEIGIKGKWSIWDTTNAFKYKIEFQEKESRDDLLGRKTEMEEEKIARIEEWLSWEERVKRNNMLEAAEWFRRDAEKNGMEVKVKKESSRVKIGEAWYEWGEEEDRLRKIKGGKE